MDTPTGFDGLTQASKRVAQRLLTIGQNRFELLIVEAQEERERLMMAAVLAMAGIALGVLTGFALTIALILMMWPYSAMWTAFVLTALYGTGSFLIFLKLSHLRRDWKTFHFTMEQFQKDLQCLNDIIP